MRIVIAGGGTAGHVTPAIALARALEHEVTFIGTAAGAESKLVPEGGWTLEIIDVRGFDRARPLSIFGTGARAAQAVTKARSLLKRLRAEVVVGMGGYVSLPVCLAARALRIPVVVHEQNIVFGLANRIAKRMAVRVAVSFEESLPEAGPRGVVTGNPVRPEFVDFDRSKERAAGLGHFDLDASRKTLLVFGGSLGARRVNEAAVGLAALWSERADVQILHVIGRAGYTPAATVESGALVYRTVDFVDRMEQAYALSDLALCRGGASTVAELTAVGLPSVIVPYPHHRDLQQVRHARVLEAAGAAVVLDDADASAARVAEIAGGLLADRESLAKMGDAARDAGHPDAARRLARVVQEAAA